MAIRTLDLTLEGTTSLSRETATGIRPPGGIEGEGGIRGKNRERNRGTKSKREWRV
jgi:hypothetical protein